MHVQNQSTNLQRILYQIGKNIGKNTILIIKRLAIELMMIFRIIILGSEGNLIY